MKDVDSSSNWLMMVLMVFVLLMAFVRKDRTCLHDGTVPDDVDNEMY